MSSPWSDEFWRITGAAVVLLIIGAIVNRPFLVLLIGAILYISWHLYNVYRLESWLRDGTRFHPPDAPGLWGEVYHRLYQLQVRNRERKRRLTNMLERFQEATTAMPDATVVMRANNEIEWFNEASVTLFGLRPKQDVGQHIGNLVRRPKFTEYLRRGEFGEPIEFPSPVTDRIILQVHIVPYGNDLRLLVGRNVTRLHQLEQMRRDFVANVSHELRTPLTVISGFLETMADDTDEYCSEQWGESLKLMQDQANRMHRIVEDLLLLARLEANSTPEARDPVSVPSLLAGIREDALRVGGEKNHQITVEADERLWLYGNEQQLRSAFSNLVINAVRYTPKGGTIRLRWFRTDDGARLDVSDTGIGVPAHLIPRLTERFFRVDVGRSRESGGTGLGLAIVKHVLIRHRARLIITSTPGVGSTFSCLFPAETVLDRDHAN